MPSVYKKSQREDSGYLIVSEDKHYEEIINNLKQPVKKRRPVMIFFDSLSDASRFYESDIFKPYQRQTVVLN